MTPRGGVYPRGLNRKKQFDDQQTLQQTQFVGLVGDPDTNWMDYRQDGRKKKYISKHNLSNEMWESGENDKLRDDRYALDEAGEQAYQEHLRNNIPINHSGKKGVYYSTNR